MRGIASFGAGLLVAACALVSCSPQMYVMSTEMRYPSSSGLDLTGKSVALVYPYGLTQDEMQLTGAIAEALADRLDAAYPESDSTGLYSIEYRDDMFPKMASADSLASLVMKTDADVVFLFGRSEEFKDGYRTGEFRLPMYCYDSLSGDKNAVKTFAITGDAGSDASLSGKNIGGRISNSFVPTWREEEFDIWYTDKSEWTSALLKALDFKWNDAIKDWMSLLDSTKDSSLRACLEYNIGLGCFMMGRSSLALQWLELSARENADEQTGALISRVKKSL